MIKDLPFRRQIYVFFFVFLYINQDFNIKVLRMADFISVFLLQFVIYLLNEK